MKKRIFTRTISVVLALLVVMSCFVTGSLSASAATYRNGYQSGPSTSYKNGRYYQNYLKVPITGDNRTDLLAIALSQLGYQEGASNGAFSGEVSGGQNYVEFSYNMGDLGLGYGGSDYPWCASFVSWCLYQSHCTDQATYKDLGRNHVGDYTYIWKEISCSQWVRQLKGAGYYKYSAYEGGSYTPKYGDLVFFQNSKGVAHIGICLYTSGGRIYTVEGNTSDASGLEANGGGVYFKNYALSTSYINGYGVLPYKSNSSVAKIDYSGANPTTGLYVANAAKYIYSSETATSYSYVIPRFSMFEITKIGTGGTRLYGTFTTTTGATVTGWISNNSDRIIQLSSSAPSVTPEELAREELEKTLESANNIRHYNYTEAKIFEIRAAYKTAVSLLNNTSATQAQLTSANTTLANLLKETGSNTIAINNKGVYVNGRNSYIGSGDCHIFSNTWNNGLITVDNANIRYTVNVVVKWSDALNCNVVKSVSEGTGSSTPSIQLSEGEWLIAAHDWESGLSASDNPIEYSSTNCSILKNLEVGSRVYVSGATALNAGTDVEPAAFIKFGPADSAKMTGKNTKAEKGDFILYTPEFNSGLITHANANVHKTLNVIAQWDDPKGAWVVTDKFHGNGKEDESSNIEIVDGQVVISGYAWEVGVEDGTGVPGSTANFAKLDTAQIGDTVVFSGITPTYGVNTRSVSANVSFVSGVQDAPDDDTQDAEPVNLALGKDYEAEETTHGYNASLTDGAYATSLDYTNKGQWFGFNKYVNALDNVGYITVDLLKAYSLNSFRMHLSEDDFSSGVAQPEFIEVAVSANGTDFTCLGNLSALKTSTQSYWAEYTLDEAQTGRYVRFYLYNNADGYTWNMLNEVEIYGTEIEGKQNIALGAEQIAIPAGEIYTTSLTDGVADSALGEGKWFGFLSEEVYDECNTVNGVGSVVLDLGARYKISDLRAHFFAGENKEEIYAPAGTTVYVSTDGETYAKAGTLAISEDSKEPFWTELSEMDAVGRYVRLDVETQGKWTLLNEFEVYGTPHAYAEDNNIALEKTYTAPGFADSPFTANLTDGTASAIFQYGVNNSSWFGFKNTGDATTGNTTGDRGIVTIDLGGQAEITGTKIHMLAGANDAGAVQPAYVNVYISGDGETFDYMGYVNSDPTATAPYWLELTPNDAVYARYIKYAFGINSGALTLLNEIKVSGTMLTSVEADEPGSMSSVAVTGDFNNWNATPNMSRAEGSTVSYAVELEAGHYEFKILEGSTWLGNNGVIENTTATTSDVGWEMTEDAANCILNATGGVYTFLFDTQTKMLKVLHTPDTFYIRGSFNDWGTSDVLTENADGTFSKTLTLEAGTYEFKAANEDYSKQWPEFNQSLTLERKSDVTFTLDIFANTLTTSERVNEFVVTFTDYDGTVLSTQLVKRGEGATAPAAPSRDLYAFAGWNKNFAEVTEDITVRALYTPTHGTLKVDMAGGAGFTISVDGSTPRPQGHTYLNSRFQIGATVTVKALTTADSEFIGWINPITGVVVSTDTAYTFTASGNDFYKAMFSVKIEGVQMVTFKNDKANRILDSQYYAQTDEISFPVEPTQVGFDFAGWSMTEEEIRSEIAKGKDVTVVAKWTKVIVPVKVTVIGGTGSGTFPANNQVTVTADAAPAGQTFAYWTDAEGNIKSYNMQYSFFPAADTVLTAVFAEEGSEIDYQILVSLDYIDTKTIADKNIFGYSWYCPDTYTFVDAGIIAVNKDNYNEDTFVVGSTDGNVYDRGPSGTDIKPINTFTWTKSNVASGQTWRAMAYVQYRDASGSIVTVYSDVVEATKD